MSPFVRFFVSFALLMTLKVSWAQEYQFKITGTYPVNSQAVNFQMQWNDVDNKVNGIYKDNYTNVAYPIQVTDSPGGQTFTAVFPLVSDGFKSVDFLFRKDELLGPNVYMSVTPRDAAGLTIHTTNILAAFEASRASELQCDVGFGDLTGYCGMYEGSVTETSDTLGYCNLEQSTLEVNSRTNMKLFINPQTFHNLGFLPLTPLSETISQKTRNCGPLSGTTMAATNCQSLILEGTFAQENGARTFKGSYVIVDEQSKNTCTYDLTLKQSKPYK